MFSIDKCFTMTVWTVLPLICSEITVITDHRTISNNEWKAALLPSCVRVEERRAQHCHWVHSHEQRPAVDALHDPDQTTLHRTTQAECQMAAGMGCKQWQNTQWSTAKHYHRRTLAQPWANGDLLSRWRMAKFDPSQVRDPSTDR